MTRWHTRVPTACPIGLYSRCWPTVSARAGDHLAEGRGELATLEETPASATHWSRSAMAARSGLSPSTIGRIWRRFDLKPHLSDGFKLSADPMFVEKVVDVVGLYHDSPDKAVVLCVDESPALRRWTGLSRCCR